MEQRRLMTITASSEYICPKKIERISIFVQI